MACKRKSWTSLNVHFNAGIPYIAILLTQVIVARVSTWKLRESGNKSELEKEECGKEKQDE